MGADGRFHLMQVVYSLGQGGSETIARDLALRVDPSRIRSSVCAIDFGGPLADDLQRAAIPFFIMGRRPGFDWRLPPKLYGLFRRERVDIVGTHHLTQLIYAGLGARLAGAVLVHVEHEYFSLMNPKAKRRFRVLAPLCHQVVAVGDEVRAFLLREVGLSPSKVIVIRNGVDVARYSSRARMSRETLGLPTEDRLIGHVGRLEAEKDQTTLLLAFRVTLNSYPNARLIVVGDGALRGDLERVAMSHGIAKRVDFLGLRKDVADLLPHFEAFVLSSVNEGLPLAVLEAMACARPVIATSVGDLPQVICHGVNGLLVPLGDPVAMAGAIATVLEQPEQAEKMGRAARRLIEEKFSLTHTVTQYQALIDSLLCRKGVRWQVRQRA